ncbi:phosphatase PAP2 family protein [Pigmentiphaga sp.]|uniref:phosphatase PAP2 family protein n=1 Tax=Pigmentiphaga sp. TaxID=1977564 RepID=UPI0025F73A4D|nr:phosphatase PAP2 family protein [Pigmentiphaga sp.]
MTTLELIAGRYAGFAFLAWLAGACALGLWVGRLLDASRSIPARRTRVMAALIVGGVAVFGLIAANVVTESRLVAVDKVLAEALAEHASPAWLRFLAVLTVAGDRDFLLGLGTLVLALLLWRRRWYDALLWLAGTLGAAGLNVLLKSTFQRVRPEHLHGFTQELGWSFPSGHATGAMAVYGMLAYLLAGLAPPAWRKAMAMSAAGLIAAVGYSRVMLQVHFLSDVIAAFAITAAWLMACVAVRERAGRPLTPSGPRSP